MEELPLEARSLAGQVRASLRGPRTSFWQPSAYLGEGTPERRRLLVVNDNLRWLHQHWDLRGSLADPPARRGAKARVKLLIRRAMRSSLSQYFEEEHELVANIVRVVDALAKRIDDIEADDERLVGALRAELVDLASSVEERLEQLGAGA
jgi:hypothetical protein